MVLNRLLKRTPAPVVAAVPAGDRVYAVGDIHGRRDLLDDLLAQIDADDSTRGPARTTLIFLGDLVDRGPDSRGVVERLIEIAAARPGTRFLMGNHEEVFLQAVEGDLKALRFLIRIGGKPTVLSYGISEADYNGLSFEELDRLLGQKVPRAHVDFLRTFEDHVSIGDYLFVHAGIRPRTAIGEQSRSDLRWIRSEFLDYRGSHGQIVVHGHSISDGVDERPNRIGIDTGAFATDRLTALGLEGSERWYLST